MLHFGQRGADDLRGGHRARQRPTAVLARQHEQVLAVAAHPGREVVELVQPAEDLGILFVLLHAVEDHELTFHEILTAPREVHEHRVDVLPQHGLLPREPDRLTVDGVERPGHLAELVARVDGHGFHRTRVHVLGRRVFLGEDVVDRRGQLVLGDVERTAAQRPQRTQQRPRDHHRQNGPEQQRPQHHPGVGPRRAARVGRERVGTLLQVLQQLLLHALDQVHGVGGGAIPLVGRQSRQIAAVLGPGEHRLHDAVAQVDHETDDRVVVHAPLTRRRERGEVVLRRGELCLRRHQGALHVLGETAARQCLCHHGAPDRQLVLDPRQRVGHEPAPGEFAVDGVGDEHLTDTEHVRDQVAVRAEHRLRRQRRVLARVPQPGQGAELLADAFEQGESLG